MHFPSVAGLKRPRWQDAAEQGSTECTGETDVAYVQKAKVQASTGFCFYSRSPGEQLLEVDDGSCEAENKA